MTTTDKLLRLIEEEDPEKILSQPNLVQKLDELLKYGLIELQNGKIILTRQGKQAKQEGVQTFIKNLEVSPEPVVFSGETRRKNKSFLLIGSFLLLLISVLLLLLVLITHSFSL